MSKGEICQLTATSDLAYGKEGKPGLYPLLIIHVFEIRYLMINDLFYVKSRNNGSNGISYPGKMIEYDYLSRIFCAL